MKYNFGFYYFIKNSVIILFNPHYNQKTSINIHHLTERKGEGNIILSIMEPLEMWTWVKL